MKMEVEAGNRGHVKWTIGVIVKSLDLDLKARGILRSISCH